MLTARALYSNVSESPDELSFNQGDVLAVLQKDVNGLSGWWLCWIDGRLGLAPGNRLKVTARRVEPDDDDNTRPLEPPELRSTDDSKWNHVVKGLQQNDSNDSRQIYDVPPTVNSSSSLPQNTSNESYEIVYDVPPSSKTANHDKPRKVEFAGKTEGQDPCQTRNQSHVSHKTMSTTTPGTAAAHHQLRAFPSRETTTGRAETSPDSTGQNPSEDVRGDDGRRMGSVVRVCVEDDDDLSSEDTVVSSTRTPRGLDVDLLRAEPGNRAPSSSSKYDNVSGATGSVAEEEEEEEEETGRLLSSVKRLTFYDPRSTGKAATLPRRIADGGTGRSEALGPITNRGYADHRSYHRSPAVQPSSSVSSGPSRTVGRLKVYDEYDSFTDNYYSVPTKWKTLPSPRYRQSSDSIGRQQLGLFPTELGSVGRPSPPPKEDAVRTRRSRSEVRPTGDASDDPEYHLSFVDTGIFVDCPQDPRSVSETMESLQETVRCRTDMIRDLCLGLDLSAAPAGAGGDARRNEADTVVQMKACCRSLRAALSEFADLGTGVLANAMQSPSRDMSENILQQLETLHALSEDLNDAVDSVIGASRGEPVGRRRANLRDAINSLLAITQDIVQPLDSLAYLVAKNSAVIFSAGRALPPPPPPVPGFPAIKGTRSPSSTSLIALPGTAGEFNFLPSNITTQALFSPRSIVEMHPGSPNILYIRNPSPGNPIHGRVAVDGKTGAQSPEFFRSFPNHRSSSPTPTVQALPLYFRSMTSSVPPCYSQPSNLPMVGPMIGGTGPEISGPRGYLQARPPLPLPLEEEGAIVDHRSNDETVDWKSVENEYSSVASEAERDMKRNAGVLVGRLIERYGEAPSQFLRFDDPSSLAPPTNLGTLSPRRPTERTDERTGHVSEFLTRIDREIVQFYIEEVRSHCDAVKFAVDDVLGSLVDDGSATGGSGLFVTLSRRVVLAAHKLLIAGDAVAKKFAFDAELRSRVGSIANDLDNGLRRTLVASQAGARRPTDGGNHSRRTEMIDCANQVKFLSVKLRDLISAYVFDRIE